MDMTLILVIALLIFIGINFLYWKVTHNYGEREYGKKAFNKWGTRMYYWQVGLLYSGALTVFIIYILKWAGVISF